MPDGLRTRLLARANLEDLAVRCLTPACLALMREATVDDTFDWGLRAGRLAVDLAVALRSRAAELTATMGEAELAVLAEQLLRGEGSGPPS